MITDLDFSYRTAALVLLTLLVLAKLVFRATWAAVVVAALVIGTIDVLWAQEPAVAWLTIGLGHVLLGYLVLFRYGVWVSHKLARESYL